jgi:acyl-CoA thioesterase-2
MSGDPMTLADILTLEETGRDRWRAGSPPGSFRNDIFGGQVAGQSLRAAGLTVEADHQPNSVHCYFLRRGQAALPVDIEVERVRDGRTYTSRRVDVRQDGRTIFAMLASFHADEPSREFDHPMPEGIPDPETLHPAEPLPWERDIEVRPLDLESPTRRWWGRVRKPFPADPSLHYCGLLYASDMRAGGVVMATLGLGRGLDAVRDGRGVPIGNFGSLDHALWWHRAPVIDDWFFCEVRPLTIRDSRGLVFGTMFDRAGRHLVTFTQETFLKEGDRPPGLSP